MKHILYMCNVGQRDVLYKNELIGLKNTRDYSKLFLKDYENEKDNLSIPIIQKGIDYILKKENNCHLSICLFCTDQNDEAYRNSDTIYMAEIIQKKMKDLYGIRDDSIRCVRIKQNPSNYEKMYGFYQQKLPEISKSLNKLDHVYISNAGGTPACNMSLTLHGTIHFGLKSSVLELPLEGEAGETRLAHILVASYERSLIRGMLESFNFKGCAHILSQHTEDPVKMNLAILCQYAHHRLLFDFEKAEENISSLDCSHINLPDSLSGLYPNMGTMVDMLLNQIQVLRQTIEFGSGKPMTEKKSWYAFQRKILCEIALNALIKYRTGQYTDFLGRMFRLQEGMLRLAFEEITGYSTDLNAKDEPTEFLDYLQSEKGKETQKYIEKNTTIPVSFSKPNTYNLRTILQYYFSTDKNLKIRYKKYIHYADKIDIWKSFRNKSIIAHGAVGITENIIQSPLAKRETVHKLLSGIVHELDKDYPLNVYTELSQLVKDNFRM
ncbi:MAG: hypothetical protein PWP06_1075 [Candidatus Marinimicrobia bacterium]|nr:hypothetical protein [Candidatus Neomarinimicrobiota bacterium]